MIRLSALATRIEKLAKKRTPEIVQKARVRLFNSKGDYRQTGDAEDDTPESEIVGIDILPISKSLDKAIRKNDTILPDDYEKHHPPTGKRLNE